MLNYAALLFSPWGRLRRRLYWRATLILVAATWAPQIIPRIGLAIAAAVSVAAIYCYVCLYIRRLHDLGRSGWWQLIPGSIAVGAPVGGLVMARVLFDAETAYRLGVDPLWFMQKVIPATWIVSTVVFVGFHIVLGVLRGQKGANRFGPDPLNPVDIEVF